MHKHRILYIHEEGMSFGGGSTSLLHLIKALDRRRFEPVILCPGTWGLRQEVEKLDVRVIPTWLPSWTKGKSLPFIIPAIVRLARFLKREKICLIFYSGIRNIPYGYLATRFVKIPSVCRLFKGAVAKKWHTKFYFVHSPTRYIISCGAARDILESGGIDVERLMVIHHGVNVYEFESSISKEEARKILGLKADIPIILSMGRFVPVKGYEFLIRAVSFIKETVNNIKLIIIAEKPNRWTDKTSGKYYESLIDLVSQLSLHENVDFVDFKYGAEKNAYLSAMDVFVLPSIDEDFGIVLLEAMAMRRPIVASNVGGIPEIVVNGETGILIPAADPLGISKAVVELLLDSQKSNKMGDEGRKRLESYFTIEREAEEHQRLYGKLLSSCSLAHS